MGDETDDIGPIGAGGELRVSDVQGASDTELTTLLTDTLEKLSPDLEIPASPKKPDVLRWEDMLSSNLLKDGAFVNDFAKLCADCTPEQVEKNLLELGKTEQSLRDRHVSDSLGEFGAEIEKMYESGETFPLHSRIGRLFQKQHAARTPQHEAYQRR